MSEKLEKEIGFLTKLSEKSGKGSRSEFKECKHSKELTLIFIEREHILSDSSIPEDEKNKLFKKLDEKLKEINAECTCD